MNKICFLICGLPRSIDLTMRNIDSLFSNYDINYYICTSNAIDSEYFNCKSCFNHSKIQNVLFLKDEVDNTYRNTLNYFKKIFYGLKLIEPIYDLYIIIRSDLIIGNINFIKNIDKNTLYFSSNSNNCFTKNMKNKINEQIIISSDFEKIKQFNHLFDYSLKNNNYSDIVLFDFIHFFNIEYQLIDIDYRLVLSRCNIIAISGDSGSGKSTLMKYLQELYDNKVIQFETDRYHKWERGDKNYETMTHLNPLSNHLEMMNSDVYNLKIGNNIYQVDYDHNTGKFTDKQQIESKNNIILCGLHTLFSDKMNEIIDLKIFMDTERKIIKKWKLQRDILKRGYSLEQITKQIQDRENDYYLFIDHQKYNADIIIHFYENNSEQNGCLKCQFIIQNNNNIFSKISSFLLKNQYCVVFEEKKVVVELQKRDNYYNEIFEIILFYVS
jgi:uridine kinase